MQVNLFHTSEKKNCCGTAVPSSISPHASLSRSLLFLLLLIPFTLLTLSSPNPLLLLLPLPFSPSLTSSYLLLQSYRIPFCTLISTGAPPPASSCGIFLAYHNALLGALQGLKPSLLLRSGRVVAM